MRVKPGAFLFFPPACSGCLNYIAPDTLQLADFLYGTARRVRRSYMQMPENLILRLIRFYEEFILGAPRTGPMNNINRKSTSGTIPKALGFSGAGEGIRTSDLLITREQEAPFVI